MSMRTPLGKVRGLGSAKEGTGHFWHQRLTAVANIPLVALEDVSEAGFLGSLSDQLLLMINSLFN